MNQSFLDSHGFFSMKIGKMKSHTESTPEAGPGFPEDVPTPPPTPGGGGGHHIL